MNEVKTRLPTSFKNISGLVRRGGYVLVLFMLTVGVNPSCGKRKGTSEQTATLPPLVLRDDTADLMLTWIDEKGEFHTVQRIPDVPPNYADIVRVVVTSQDEGAATYSIYVTDLRNKQADGTYATRAMARAEWEALATARRSPPGRVVGAENHETGGRSGLGPDDAGAKDRVIVYGASWCGPCHQVTDELRRRGIPYLYKDIEQEPGAADEMQRKLAKSGRPSGSIPVIDVGGRLLIGYDPRALDAALAEKNRGRAPL